MTLDVHFRRCNMPERTWRGGRVEEPAYPHLMRGETPMWKLWLWMAFAAVVIGFTAVMLNKLGVTTPSRGTPATDLRDQRRVESLN